MKRITRMTLLAALVVSILLFAALPVSAETSIADLINTDGRLTIFEATLAEAGLLDTLKGPGPFTLAVPTDGALAALPADLTATYLDDLPALTDLLLAQVQAGGITASDLLWLSQAATLLSEDVTIEFDGNSIVIDKTLVLTVSEAQAYNGLLYIIDAEQIVATALSQQSLPSRDYPLTPSNSSGVAQVAEAKLPSRNYPLQPSKPVGAMQYRASLALVAQPVVFSPPFREPYDGPAQPKVTRLAYQDTFVVTAEPDMPRLAYQDTFVMTASTEIAAAYRDWFAF